MIEQLTYFLKQEIYGNITLSSRKHDKYIGYFSVYIVIEEGYFDLEFRHEYKYEKEPFKKAGESYLPITPENIQEAASFVNKIIKERYLKNNP